MDPEQLQILVGYAVFVSVASLILRRAIPDWTRTRIAFITGGLLPLLGLAFTALAFVRMITAGGHPMGMIGILIGLFLSLACLVGGIILSLVVTTIVRAR